KTRRLLFDIVHYLWLSILLSISFIARRDDFHAAAPNRGAASQAAASRLIGTLRPVCGLPRCVPRRPIQFLYLRVNIILSTTPSRAVHYANVAFGAPCAAI